MNKLKITIEGEQGAGKSTAARAIAEMLNLRGAVVVLRDAEHVETFLTQRPAVCDVLIETRFPPVGHGG